MITLAIFPEIQAYYRFPKSNGAQITTTLLERHSELQSLGNTTRPAYVILPAITDTDGAHLDTLLQQGFSIRVAPPLNWYHTRYLLYRR